MTVTLFGGSGTMGFEAFKELWKRNESIHVKLLLLDHSKERKLFSPYLKCKDKLSIIWGDATNYEDVKKAVSGTDWVLDAMAFISPQADYYRKIAKAVNIKAIENIVLAIGEEPDGNDRIPLVYTGTVAATGDRLNEIRFGRTGDPLKPSIYDTYAVTKIAGERIVMESSIKRWVSLRMTFIMPDNWKALIKLYDPIFFHQPLNTHMENISSKDAGFGLVKTMDLPDNSDFWRRVYNMGGGPEMRCTAWQFLKISLSFSGLNTPENVYERKWFALQNFHMQYYFDSHILNNYLNYQRDTLSAWGNRILASQGFFMKMIRYLCIKSHFIKSKIEIKAKESMRSLAEDHPNGTVYWFSHNNDKRLMAFFGGRERYLAIPDWDKNRDFEGPFPEPIKLNHGYDESKIKLTSDDLKGIAIYRGGLCMEDNWNGDIQETVKWKCTNGHNFSLKVNTVVKGGHWCPDCNPPNWNYDCDSERNPYFRQVWRQSMNNFIFKEIDCDDISLE